jgi:hypothetical protein
MVVHGYNLFVQFTIGEMVFLLHKHTHVANVVIFGVVGNLFHAKEIVDGVYKVEVQGLMLLDASFPFPNYNDSFGQLLFKQVCGQFTLWESAMMGKAR